MIISLIHIYHFPKAFARQLYEKMSPRQTEAAKLAPTVVESPQLQRRICGLAGEDLQRKAGDK